MGQLTATLERCLGGLVSKVHPLKNDANKGKPLRHSKT
jgi:hypothetical protein